MKRSDVWGFLASQAASHTSCLSGEKAAETGDDHDDKADESNPAQDKAAAGEKATEDEQVRPESTFMLVVGAKGSGKTSMVGLFLNASSSTDKKPKPTAALEYTYGRRSNSTSSKDLCQIWELGGGDKLVDLISVVLTPEREPHTCVVVCVDLGRPDKALSETCKWTEAIRNVSKRVPMIVLGTKYDLFQNEDALKRKALAQALRFACVDKKAGLVFVSPAEKNSVGYMRAILNHYAFCTEKKRSFYVDTNKPIIVAPGRDRVEKIGLPQGMTAETPARKVYQALNDIIREYFPSTTPADDDEEEASQQGDERKSEQLELAKENVVDLKRKQKDQELQQYRARVERDERVRISS